MPVAVYYSCSRTLLFGGQIKDVSQSYTHLVISKEAPTNYGTSHIIKSILPLKCTKFFILWHNGATCCSYIYFGCKRISDLITTMQILPQCAIIQLASWFSKENSFNSQTNQVVMTGLLPC